MFEQYAQFLHRNYPHMSIVGDNYPPPLLRQYLARILGFVKLAIIAIILMGDQFQLLESFNIQPPEIYSWAKQNKMYAIMLVFFLSNAIEGQLISTGAFEVALNDMPVWSKLESGRLPSPEELFQIVDQQVKFNGR